MVSHGEKPIRACTLVDPQNAGSPSGLSSGTKPKGVQLVRGGLIKHFFLFCGGGGGVPHLTLFETHQFGDSPSVP